MLAWQLLLLAFGVWGVPTPFQAQVPKPLHCTSALPRLIDADILKARITTDTLKVNPKGIQEFKFKIDNHCDYIKTTNNANAVNIHDKSVRFLLVETTSY